MNNNYLEEYYDLEEELHENDSRKKILHKTKSHNKKKWKKSKTIKINWIKKIIIIIQLKELNVESVE